MQGFVPNKTELSGNFTGRNYNSRKRVALAYGISSADIQGWSNGLRHSSANNSKAGEAPSLGCSRGSIIGGSLLATRNFLDDQRQMHLHALSNHSSQHRVCVQSTSTWMCRERLLLPAT